MTNASKTFHNALDERNESTSRRLDQLSDRISTLEERFDREKAEILATIEERGRELKRMLNLFKVKIMYCSQSSHFFFS